MVKLCVFSYVYCKSIIIKFRILYKLNIIELQMSNTFKAVRSDIIYVRKIGCDLEFLTISEMLCIACAL